MTQIKGYTYGKVGSSPLTLTDLELLQKTVLFTDEDKEALKMAGQVLRDQVDDVLDLWYGFVGGNTHLVHYFTSKGTPDAAYLSAVRARFGQWIIDLCERPYDQDWLNYQHEIALRHHSAKKNQTDGVDSVPIIHYRYMIGLIYPITATIRGFLGKKGHSDAEIDRMHQAWFKAVTISAILWTYPYIRQGEF